MGGRPCRAPCLSRLHLLRRRGAPKLIVDRASLWPEGSRRTTTSDPMLDVPDEVRNKVVSEGNAAWLDELPAIVASLASDWSLTIGGTLRGGHAAFVVEATIDDG